MQIESTANRLYIIVLKILNYKLNPRQNVLIPFLFTKILSVPVRFI